MTPQSAMRWCHAFERQMTAPSLRVAIPQGQTLGVMIVLAAMIATLSPECPSVAVLGETEKKVRWCGGAVEKGSVISASAEVGHPEPSGI